MPVVTGRSSDSLSGNAGGEAASAHGLACPSQGLEANPAMGRKEGRTLSMTAVPGLLPASERLPCSVLSVGARPEPSGRTSF